MNWSVKFKIPHAQALVVTSQTQKCIEYILLAIRPCNFALPKVILDEWRYLVKFT